jgi:hypothetical protein
MASLSPDWITEKRIDFEYKKYLLLGYLQGVSEQFTESRLYPWLSELITHYRNVVALRDHKKSLYDSFPERLSGTDLKGFRLMYEKILQDDHLMQEIESIVEYSIPKFEKYLQEGKAIYDFVESHINIFPVGIMPLHTDEGYLMLKFSPGKETLVYEYQITIFENPDEKYRGIATSFIGKWEQSLANTFENIKHELIRYHQKMPNPATYVIESDLKIPIEETFLPLARRILVKHVAAKASN